MHINYKNFINRILKFDNLYKNVDFEKFNFEERELLKNLGYTNQQLNFLNKFFRVMFMLDMRFGFCVRRQSLIRPQTGNNKAYLYFFKALS